MAVQGFSNEVSALSMSEDGANWRNTFEAVVTSLTFGNGLFIAKHQERIYSSTDGETWVTRRLPLAVSSNDIRYALGRFWVLAQARPGETNYTLLSSRDGLAWLPALTNAPARGILFGDEGILVLGGDSQIATSDGVEFVPLPSFPQVSALGRIGQTWVGQVADGFGRNVAVSTNGTNWAAFSPSPFFGGTLSVVNDRFVMRSESYFFESTDGFNWTDHDVGLRYRITDLIFGRDTILALAYQALDTPKPGVYTRVARILRSRPLTPTGVTPLSLSLRPSLSIQSGFSGAGYAIESATHPEGPWIPAATVFPTRFPYHFLAPLEADPKRFYRAVPYDR